MRTMAMVLWLGLSAVAVGWTTVQAALDPESDGQVTSFDGGTGGPPPPSNP